MTEIWKWGRVQFAQEDYQLLVGAFLIIFAIITIGYFSIFMESGSHDEVKEPEHHETSHSGRADHIQTTSSSAKKELEPEHHEEHVAVKKSPAKETPKKHRRSTSKHSDDEAPLTRGSTGSSKSPAHHQSEGENHEDDGDHQFEAITPARRRGRKKADKSSEDLGQLLSPEGKRTSLRLKRRKGDE